MKLITILGARPQFIKAGAVSCAISNALHGAVEVIEAVEAGWNILVGTYEERMEGFRCMFGGLKYHEAKECFGQGNASGLIVVEFSSTKEKLSL